MRHMVPWLHVKNNTRLYEMATGGPPFKANDLKQLY